MRVFRRHPAVDVESVRPQQAAVAMQRELAMRFESDGRVAIEDVLAGDLASAIAAALPSLHLSRSAPDPRGLGGDDPGHMFYEACARSHRGCRRLCAPVCALVASLEAGPLLDFLRAVIGRPDMSVHSVSVRAYVKGSHVSCGAGAEAVWYGTPRGNPHDGGLVRFGAGDEWPPSFGTMHVVGGERRAVTLVGQHRTLYAVRALLGTR